MINKLSLDDRGNDVTFVGAVAKSLFADGTTNWGRITSLIAFGAAVCQSLKEKGRENCVELVGQNISDYLVSEQGDWMVKNNSWVSRATITGCMDKSGCITARIETCPVSTVTLPLHQLQILIPCLCICLQDGFVEFFRVADPEFTVRNTLMAFAGFAGLGATLALMIR